MEGWSSDVTKLPLLTVARSLPDPLRCPSVARCRPVVHPSQIRQYLTVGTLLVCRASYRAGEGTSMAKGRLLLMVLLTVALISCGNNEAVVSQASPSPSRTSSAAVPDDVKQALERGGPVVEDAQFEGGLSAKQALRRFHEDYGTDYQSEAVYAVRVTDSDSPILVDSEAWMVHVPDVPAQFEGVAPPPGVTPPSEVPGLADTFAFYDAATGRMLVAEHIAQDDGF